MTGLWRWIESMTPDEPDEADDVRHWREWCVDRVGRICLLPARHEGPHEWSDKDDEEVDG